jgi:hypothetical protein
MNPSYIGILMTNGKIKANWIFKMLNFAGYYFFNGFPKREIRILYVGHMSNDQSGQVVQFARSL